MTGTPYDDGDPETDDALTYSLTGNAKDSGLFVIDSASGQISVATGATIDYETDDTYRETETHNEQVIAKFYRGKVNYTVDGNASAIEVLIKITDVDTGKPAAPTVTRTEFAEKSNPALDVTWTAPSADGTITGYKAQYRKSGETNWTDYTITDANNQPTSTLPASITTINLPNLEAGATYEVQVRAVTGGGDGPWSDTGEGTANRAPTATSASFNGGTFPVGTVAEYRETGPGALGVLFSDPDSDALTYSAVAAKPALLGVSLSGDAGEAHLRVTLLNQGATSGVTLTASDPYGGQATRTTSIGVTAKVSREIAENSPAGTRVGAPVTGTPYDDGDPETDDALTYTLTGEAADSGAFVIAAATGQISVATGASLDHDTKSSYTGQVEYDVGGQTSAVDLTINVTNMQAPRTPAAPSVTGSETDPTDTLDVDWRRPSTSGGRPITGYNVRYRVVGATAWTRHPFSGRATATSIGGVEAGISYEVQVRARNSDGR